MCVCRKRNQVPNSDVCLMADHGNQSHNPSWKSLLYTVPAGIMDIIPVEVKRLLGCESNPLVVVRNLNLVDVCAGKARLPRWATWGGGAGCCGRSGICSPYGRKHLGGPSTRNRANPAIGAAGLTVHRSPVLIMGLDRKSFHMPLRCKPSR